MDLLSTTFFNANMLKTGPQGPKHYVFGDHFYSTIARKIRFYVFLHFSARKYTISSFYLKWTKFPRDCDILPVQFGFPGTHSWNKTHNTLWIQTTSGKMMISYIFEQEKGEIRGIWAFWHFQSKSAHQKCGVWIPGNPMQNCFCSAMSLFEETYKLSDQTVSAVPVKQYSSLIDVKNVIFSG